MQITLLILITFSQERLPHTDSRKGLYPVFPQNLSFGYPPTLRRTHAGESSKKMPIFRSNLPFSVPAVFDDYSAEGRRTDRQIPS